MGAGDPSRGGGELWVPTAQQSRGVRLASPTLPSRPGRAWGPPSWQGPWYSWGPPSSRGPGHSWPGLNTITTARPGSQPSGPQSRPPPHLVQVLAWGLQVVILLRRVQRHVGAHVLLHPQGPGPVHDMQRRGQRTGTCQVPISPAQEQALPGALRPTRNTCRRGQGLTRPGRREQGHDHRMTKPTAALSTRQVRYGDSAASPDGREIDQINILQLLGNEIFHAADCGMCLAPGPWGCRQGAGRGCIFLARHEWGRCALPHHIPASRHGIAEPAQGLVQPPSCLVHAAISL